MSTLFLMHSCTDIALVLDVHLAVENRGKITSRHSSKMSISALPNGWTTLKSRGQYANMRKVICSLELSPAVLTVPVQLSCTEALQLWCYGLSSLSDSFLLQSGLTLQAYSYTDGSNFGGLHYVGKPY